MALVAIAPTDIINNDDESDDESERHKKVYSADAMPKCPLQCCSLKRKRRSPSTISCQPAPPCRPASQSDSHGWSVKQSHCPAPIGIGAFEERTISESPSLTGPIYPLRSCCRTTAKSGLVTLFDSDPWRPHEACHCQRQHQRLTSASQQRLIRDASHAALITPDYPHCTPIASALAFLLIALDLHGCTKQPRLLFFSFLSLLHFSLYYFCSSIFSCAAAP